MRVSRCVQTGGVNEGITHVGNLDAQHHLPPATASAGSSGVKTRQEGGCDALNGNIAARLCHKGTRLEVGSSQEEEAKSLFFVCMDG